jgi:hypothetical protein
MIHAHDTVFTSSRLGGEKILLLHTGQIMFIIRISLYKNFIKKEYKIKAEKG